jgi:phosphoglycerate dehydrogenase-like enzyme
VGYLAGVEKIDEEVLAVAEDLCAISRNGTGVNSIDLAACERRGIRVLRTQGANARGVAELALGLMFSLVRSIPFSDDQLKAGVWTRRKGVELNGRELGVIGCGMVGRLVIRTALDLGMRVRGYDPFPERGFSPGDGFSYTDLDTVLQKSDVVTLHCPPSADGKPLLDAMAIDSMKPGAMLVNTARADLVDEAALLAALNAGRIGGYATDVYVTEPPEASPLLMHDRVVCTPHVGGYTEESVARSTLAAVENLLLVLQEPERGGV